MIKLFMFVCLKADQLREATPKHIKGCGPEPKQGYYANSSKSEYKQI